MARYWAKERRDFRALKVESDQIRKDLSDVMSRMSSVESEMVALRAKVEKNDKRTR